jgi:hypothetical protein
VGHTSFSKDHRVRKWKRASKRELIQGCQVSAEGDICIYEVDGRNKVLRVKRDLKADICPQEVLGMI